MGAGGAGERWRWGEGSVLDLCWVAMPREDEGPEVEASGSVVGDEVME